MIKQTTLHNSMHCTGVGLHSGKEVMITIRPAEPWTGITFRRIDLTPAVEINASIWNVTSTTLCTTITDPVKKKSVSTIEHLLAAFYALGVTNAIVDIDGPEVPIMDGSAWPFVFLIKSAGIVEQEEPQLFAKITEEIKIEDDQGGYISISPLDPEEGNNLRISMGIEFAHPSIETQYDEKLITENVFTHEIARARTFGFESDTKNLKDQGMILGGSLDNAVLLGDKEVINDEGLRSEEEFVRHKILDCVGDLSLIGSHRLIGHVKAYKTGHRLNHHLAQKIQNSYKAVDLRFLRLSIGG